MAKSWRLHRIVSKVLGGDAIVVGDLSELAVRLWYQGISSSRYVEGARIALMTWGERPRIRSACPGMYDYGKKLDLQHDKITPLLKEAFVLSKSVPVSQITNHIQQQIKRKNEVE